MRGLSDGTKGLIRYAHRLLEVDHPQTLRQLHYAIFSRREIEYDNTGSDYKRLSRATTTARRLYRAWELNDDDAPDPEYGIPGEWMVDETRAGEMPNVWTDAQGYIEAVKRSYRRDNWQDQPTHCEVWSEKATILGAIRPVAEEWGIILRVCHGFGSTGMEGEIGRLFEDIDKDITVFYLGDHDPSGHVIEEDLHRRVEEASGVLFGMERLAIHASDISWFHLPPQQIKTTDSRAAGFQRRFGTDASTVELDALPVRELRRRVEAAVRGLINFDLWNRQLAVQDVELRSIAQFAETMKRLPQINEAQ